jgi:tRNA(fMet)-specific endonuclease VapC
MQKSDGLALFLEEADEILVPAVVLGELYAGFAMGSRYGENCRELEEFLSQSGAVVIPVDTDVASRYGLVVKHLRRQGTPIPTNDIWTAATVLETGARLVTYDTHFDLVPGLAVVAP